MVGSAAQVVSPSSVRTIGRPSSSAITSPSPPTSTHLFFHDRDLVGVQGAREVIAALEGAAGLCTRLTLSHNRLGDDGAQELFHYLAQQDKDVSASGPKRRPPITQLDLTSNRIGDAGLTALARWVEGNPSLTHLLLPNNKIGRDHDALRSFIHAVNRSTLRVLSLTSNDHLGTSGILTIFAHLASFSLVELHLSVCGAGGPDVGPAIASYLSDAGPSASPAMRARSRVREGSGGQLGRSRKMDVLSLNGNDLGIDGVLSIVRALVEHNSSLVHIELFATGANSPSEAQGGPSQGAAQGVGAGAPTGLLHRTRSTSSLFIGCNRTRSSSMRHEEDRNVGSPYSTGVEVVASNWRDLLLRSMERNRAMRKLTRRRAVELRAAARVIGCAVAEASLPEEEDRVADLAGSLGKDGGERLDRQTRKRNDYFPFLRLPVELRTHILRLLDTPSPSLWSSEPTPPVLTDDVFGSSSQSGGVLASSVSNHLARAARVEAALEMQGPVLSPAQFLRVLSWSCDRSTIGFDGSHGIPSRRSSRCPSAAGEAKVGIASPSSGSNITTDASQSPSYASTTRPPDTSSTGLGVDPFDWSTVFVPSSSSSSSSPSIPAASVDAEPSAQPAELRLAALRDWSLELHGRTTTSPYRNGKTTKRGGSSSRARAVDAAVRHVETMGEEVGFTPVADAVGVAGTIGEGRALVKKKRREEGAGEDDRRSYGDGDDDGAAQTQAFLECTGCERWEWWR